MAVVRKSHSKPVENAPPKPRFRGVSHQYACFVSLVAGGALVALADGTRTRLIALAYAMSLSALLGVSALYHRINWSPKARAWMRRLDHTMIFVLIAGSYTPLALLVLEGELAQNTLNIVWSVVGFGALLNLVWIKAPKWLTSALCLATGWVCVVTMPQLYERLGGTFVALLSLGGVFYTLGALAYAFKKPNPWPRTFGYHEIFHLLVVAAAALHFTAFSIYVFAPLS